MRFRLTTKNPPETSLTNYVLVQLFDEKDNLKEERKAKNSVTQFERTLWYNYLGGKGTTAFAGARYMVIGTGATTATTDTLLLAERGNRNTTTFSYASPNATFGMLSTWTTAQPATNYTITECGLFATITSNTATCVIQLPVPLRYRTRRRV
jgi:hypothetical protein